ncbi:MAG: DUF2812 domain-containing protein [Tissierellia bacterium]|nr:DUF2812 domain-containing protein [Tissierellia bacterium]
MKKFRVYFDKDTEQDWIMEMSNQGWAFENFFLGVYTFKPSEPGEYIYQIDLLDDWMGDKKDFSEFMEDSGVEVVAQWYRWVFLRKRAEEGPFEMYTDIESKIVQYKRMEKFFLVILILESIIFLVEFLAAIRTRSMALIIATILIGLIVMILFHNVLKCKEKIEALQKEYH